MRLNSQNCRNSYVKGVCPTVFSPIPDFRTEVLSKDHAQKSRTSLVKLCIDGVAKTNDTTCQKSIGIKVYPFSYYRRTLFTNMVASSLPLYLVGHLPLPCSLLS